MSSNQQQEEKRELAFNTRAIHVGQPADPSTGAVTTPISLATTFVQTSPGVHQGYEYSRTSNPTRGSFEQQVASCEGGKYALAFGSGCAATVSVLNLCRSGDHVICIDDVYGGTSRFFRQIASPNNGYTFSYVDMNDEVAFKAAFTDKTRLVWLETPTNPTLKITDIAKAAKLTHEHGALLVVDNTFMSPALQNPLSLGADIVVHSVTKYINGHSDVVMGAVITSDDELHSQLRFIQKSIGAVPSPFDCYMAQRGLKTLGLRMREHSKNARLIAAFLEKHDKVDRVLYPGLPSHPQHELAKTQMRDFGGMVTIFLKGGLKESRQFLENIHLFKLAESLGAVESLAEHPAIMTHASVPKEQREANGISDSLIRLSVGIEDVDDLIADLSSALDAISL